MVTKYFYSHCLFPSWYDILKIIDDCFDIVLFLSNGKGGVNPSGEFIGACTVGRGGGLDVAEPKMKCNGTKYE